MKRIGPVKRCNRSSVVVQKALFRESTGNNEMKSAAISISIQTKTSADSIVAAWRNNQLFTASWTNIRILDAKEIDKPKEILQQVKLWYHLVDKVPKHRTVMCFVWCNVGIFFTMQQVSSDTFDMLYRI